MAILDLLNNYDGPLADLSGLLNLGSQSTTTLSPETMKVENLHLYETSNKGAVDTVTNGITDMMTSLSPMLFMLIFMSMMGNK
jgi:hypothetical protein